jgi:peptide deformylase
MSEITEDMHEVTAKAAMAEGLVIKEPDKVDKYGAVNILGISLGKGPVDKALQGYGVDLRRIAIPTDCLHIEKPELAKDIKIQMRQFWDKYKLGSKVLGFSAPQMGLPVRMFMMKSSTFLLETQDAVLFFTNPKIKLFGRRFTYEGEGCISFPSRRCKTVRYEWCKIFSDEFKEGRVFSGIDAIVIQHEMDHMEGVTMKAHETTQFVSDKKVGRNDPCGCGSGKKYKNCCGKNAIV